ncbi:MAG: M15 family metallopeptidase [Elusimicrobia bacterium]|nr:M15 family metallopeptidase [Elusimicrobiota bacterium]
MPGGLRPAAALLLAAALCSGCRSGPEPLVDFARVHPRAVLDIRYATPDNFTHRQVYGQARCALRRSVAERLSDAASELEGLGYLLKVFDCYRPLSVQKAFWALVPDERYVADPAKGSRHNRGAAVDVSLADVAGRELEMPTGYDDFSERARRDWAGASPAAAAHRAALERVMSRHGFVGFPSEWWHFDAQGWERYPVEDVPFADIPAGS